MNYNEIYFNYHWSSYAEKLPGILLSQVAVNIFRMGSIIRVAIIWRYISVVNIILRGNSLSASCPRANYLGDNFRASNFRGAIIRGAIILAGNYPGGNCPGSNYPGGNCPGGNYPKGNCPGGNYPGGNCPVSV